MAAPAPLRAAAGEAVRRLPQHLRLAAAHYQDIGPYLGQKKKFLVLLCERKSELGRHTKTYYQAESEHSFRWGRADEGMFFGITMETFKESWQMSGAPFDTIFMSSVMSSVVMNFMDGYRNNGFSSPTWLKQAVSHHFARLYDPRWVFGAISKHGSSVDDDLWKWEPRVKALVKNEFFISTDDLFKFKEFGEMNQRDHMVAWSRLEYLLTTDGDHAGFFNAICSPIAHNGPDKDAAVIQRQQKALHAFYGLTPAELDEKWAAWVKKTYKKK